MIDIRKQKMKSNIHQLILIILFAIAIRIETAAICDLTGYLNRLPSWKDQSTPYILPLIADYVYITPDSIKNGLDSLTREAKLILGSDKIFKFGWRILNNLDCVALIGSDSRRYFLTLADNYINTQTGECQLAIEYPLGFENFVTLWRKYIQADSLEISLPIYPCLNDMQWKNNRLFYDFTEAIKLNDIQVSQSNMNQWIDCERISPALPVNADTQLTTDNIVNEEEIANMIMRGVKVSDLKTGREYDTAAISIKKTVSNIFLKGMGASLAISDAEKKMLKTNCPHANYNISVELGILSPSALSVNESVNNDESDETNILLRGKWVTATVRDNKAPVISNIPTQPTHFPLQTTCYWEAHKYATSIIPLEYNNKVEVTDNCATRLPPPVYSSKFINLEEDLVLVPDLPKYGCAHRGSLLLSWAASDGCGNDAFVSQAIRVYDDIAPALIKKDTIVDGVIKRCMTKIPSNKILCLDDLMESTMNEVITDNCDDTEDLYFKGLWNRKSKKVQKCSSAQKPNTLKAYLSCINIPEKEIETNVRSCIILKEHWTKVNFEVEVRDTCGNKMQTEIELFVAPTEIICKSYGYL